MAAETSVEITDAELAERAKPLAERLAADEVASALAAGDATLWGPEAESEASIRLSWTGAHEASRPLLAEIESLRAELHAEGLDRVVLAGMGGSSLAPEVITATADVPLIVLDTTDPAQVADALEGDLHRTVVVVSSKSGTTVETESHRLVFEQALTDEGLDPTRHMIVVTDPGSPLETTAQEAGYRRVFTADPNVGGRYSALTAFGLVPAGLAGADIAALLDDAASVHGKLSTDSPDNPAVRLASALGAAHSAGAEKVVLADDGSGLHGFGDWAEQLIAESTGKQGKGLLPVVVENTDAPGFTEPGRHATTVALRPAGSASGDHGQLATSGPLGAQMLLWEFATALVGRLLKINPFDQPDVESSKHATRVLLEGPAGGPAAVPALVDGCIEVHTWGDWLSPGVATVTEALRALSTIAPSSGYLAVQAYLNRSEDASAAVLRPEIARRTGLQTTFGWGPRFLHSTGQYHKGGHQNGVFLQITGDAGQDLEVPGRGYTLGALQRAQALGDGQVLAQHNRPVLRLHLTDRVMGLVELVRAVQKLREK